MANTETFSMSKEVYQIAKEDALHYLGKENASGYVSYLITKARREK